MTKTTTWLSKAAVLVVCLTVAAALVLATVSDPADAKKKKKNRSNGGGIVGFALNSDLLDGLDSTAFLRSDGKAQDADKLDGKDSTAFFSGKTYEVSKNNGVFTGGGGALASAVSPNCDTGDKMISGGGIAGNEDDLVGSEPSGNVQWRITVRDNGPGSPITTKGLCADFPPLRSGANSQESDPQQENAEQSNPN